LGTENILELLVYGVDVFVTIRETQNSPAFRQYKFTMNSRRLVLRENEVPYKNPYFICNRVRMTWACFEETIVRPHGTYTLARLLYVCTNQVPICTLCSLIEHPTFLNVL